MHYSPDLMRRKRNRESAKKAKMRKGIKTLFGLDLQSSSEGQCGNL